MEEAVNPVSTIRRFAGNELISDRPPVEKAILTFPHLLQKHGLKEQVFDPVKDHLRARGMMISQGTIMHDNLITAPSSTQNKPVKRESEMRQTQKANQWYFGMAVYTGVE